MINAESLEDRCHFRVGELRCTLIRGHETDHLLPNDKRVKKYPVYLKSDTIMIALADKGLLPQLCGKVEIVDDVRDGGPLLIKYTCAVTEEIWEAIKTGPTHEEYERKLRGN